MSSGGGRLRPFPPYASSRLPGSDSHGATPKRQTRKRPGSMQNFLVMCVVVPMGKIGRGGDIGRWCKLMFHESCGTKPHAHYQAVLF